MSDSKDSRRQPDDKSLQCVEEEYPNYLVKGLEREKDNQNGNSDTSNSLMTSNTSRKSSSSCGSAKEPKKK